MAWEVGQKSHFVLQIKSIYMQFKPIQKCIYFTNLIAFTTYNYIFFNLEIIDYWNVSYSDSSTGSHMAVFRFSNTNHSVLTL